MGGLIVHEWIEKAGGAEKVVDAMLEKYPDADLYCLWNDDDEKRSERTIIESRLARSPLRRSKPFAALAAPFVWRNMHLKEHYDWMLVSSHLFAHQARLRPRSPDMPKFVYVHTPARYIWSSSSDSRGSGLLPRLASTVLRPVDKWFAQELSSVAANSRFVRDRIAKTWGIDSEIIYPPVDVARIRAVSSWADELDPVESDILNALPETFVLGASRFVPYKGLDLVIKTGAAANVPVVIAGSGPDESRLRSLASETRVPVTFILKPSDAFLFALYQRALAYVFPAVEDFGIMPVEAMAAGAPVIVNSIGGASESVIDGSTGIHLTEFDGTSLAIALERASQIDPTFSIARAKQFSKEAFSKKLGAWVAA